MVQPLVLLILIVISKNTNGKIYSPEELLHSTTGGGIFSPYIKKYIKKNIYYLTIAIINKSSEFQNDCLKRIRTRYNCTRFCPIPLCKEI